MAETEDTECPADLLGELCERLERYGDRLERTADKTERAAELAERGLRCPR